MLPKGFVLPTTILMLSMLTLLILSLMQGVLWYMKAGNQLTKRHQDFYQIETVAHILQLSHLAHQDVHCMTEAHAFDDVIERLKHHHGCEKTLGQQTYVYWIEDLGILPCLRIEAANQEWSSHHWRLTVMSNAPSHETLQLRFVKPDGLMVCDGELLHINQGIVSWRHLTTT